MTEHTHPYRGIDRRMHPSPETPSSSVQQELDDPKMAQQPNLDTSYPFRLTVKWQDKHKLKLATVLRTNEGGIPDTTCTIRLLNNSEEID
eukprot:4034278-Ditylum_brightwellii.AAC.1